MRVKVKLAKPMATLSGQWQTFTGEFDPQSGICWLDPMQGERAVLSGMGIHVASGTSVQRLDAPPAVEKKPEKTKAA